MNPPRAFVGLATAAALGAGLLAATGASAAAGAGSELARVREATAGYHRVSAAEAAGYGLFTDAAGIACIDHVDHGTMGVHYVKGDLVGDATLTPATPEALVYQPRPGGGLGLVALEYVEIQAVWDAAHPEPPVLFGREFTAVGAGNRYGLPPFYELHLWLWHHNPAGMFNDWNPSLSCPSA